MTLSLLQGAPDVHPGLAVFRDHGRGFPGLCPSHPQPRAGQPGTFLGTEKSRLGCWPRAGVWPWCCTRRAGADGFRDWHGALVPGWMGVSSATGQSQPTPGVPPVPGWQVSPQSKGTPALLDQQLRARGIILESQKATEMSLLTPLTAAAVT